MNITKDQYRELMEKLVDKTISNGCFIKHECGDEYQIGDVECIDSRWVIDSGCGCCSTVDDPINKFEIIGHPLLIGEVLEKMEKQLDSVFIANKQEQVVYFWRRCGFSKSIQQIVEGEWETVDIQCKAHANGEIPNICCCETINQLRDGAANDLLSFLYDLFCNQKEK